MNQTNFCLQFDSFDPLNGDVPGSPSYIPHISGPIFANLPGGLPVYGLRGASASMRRSVSTSQARNSFFTFR